jgi:hypothetical protein
MKITINLKAIRRIAKIVAIIAVIFTLATCDGKLNGTYGHSFGGNDEIYFTFSGNKIIMVFDDRLEGTYETKNGKIHYTVTGDNGKEVGALKYSLKGNALTLHDLDDLVLTKNYTPNSNNTKTSDNTNIPAQDVGSKLIFVSSSQITKDYHDNAVAADNKWYKKDVVIEGQINEIERDVFGRPIIYMYGYKGNDFDVYVLKFIFPDDYSLNKYKSGQKIKIKGWVGKAIMSAINIIDCDIYNK